MLRSLPLRAVLHSVVVDGYDAANSGYLGLCTARTIVINLYPLLAKHPTVVGGGGLLGPCPVFDMMDYDDSVTLPGWAAVDAAMPMLGHIGHGLALSCREAVEPEVPGHPAR